MFKIVNTRNNVCFLMNTLTQTYTHMKANTFLTTANTIA